MYKRQAVGGHPASPVHSGAVSYTHLDVYKRQVTVPAPVSGNNSLTAPDDPTIDAGLVELVSVGDYVWWDTNRDGLQTAGEVPVAGITVNPVSYTHLDVYKRQGADHGGSVHAGDDGDLHAHPQQ